MSGANDVIAAVHIGGAVSALILGAVVFTRPKGSNPHRLLGATYSVLLVLLDVSALLLHREAIFGPFHALAILSLMTILTAISIMVFTAKPPRIVATHAFLMAWSYAGLVAAGCAQFVAQLNVGTRGVWITIVATLAVSGVIIQLTTPRAIRRALNG